MVKFGPQFAKVATNVPKKRKVVATNGTEPDLNIGESPGFGGLMKRAKSTTLNCCIILLVLSLKQLDSLAQLEFFCEA